MQDKDIKLDFGSLLHSSGIPWIPEAEQQGSINSVKGSTLTISS